MGYALIISYLVLTGLLGVAHGWLTDQNLWSEMLFMPFLFTAFLFILAGLSLAIGRGILRNPAFYGGLFWFFGQVIFTFLGKLLILLGADSVGLWLYTHRTWGFLPVGGLLLLASAIWLVWEKNRNYQLFEKSY